MRIGVVNRKIIVDDSSENILLVVSDTTQITESEAIYYKYQLINAKLELNKNSLIFYFNRCILFSLVIRIFFYERLN